MPWPAFKTAFESVCEATREVEVDFDSPSLLKSWIRVRVNGGSVVTGIRSRDHVRDFLISNFDSRVVALDLCVIHSSNHAPILGPRASIRLDTRDPTIQASIPTPSLMRTTETTS
jgi:hypothetical protein